MVINIRNIMFLVIIICSKNLFSENNGYSTFSTKILLDNSLVIKEIFPIGTLLKKVDIEDIINKNTNTNEYIFIKSITNQDGAAIIEIGNEKTGLVDRYQIPSTLRFINYEVNYIPCKRKLLVMRGSTVVLERSYKYSIYSNPYKVGEVIVDLPIIKYSEGLYYLPSPFKEYPEQNCYYRILHLDGSIGISKMEIESEIVEGDENKNEYIKREEGIPEFNCGKNLLNNIIWILIGLTACKKDMCTEISGIKILNKCKQLSEIKEGDIIISTDGITISRNSYLELDNYDGKMPDKIGVLRNDKIKIIKLRIDRIP